MQAQDFVENIRNNIENVKNGYVSIGRNIIDSIKVNVSMTDFGLACSLFFFFLGQNSYVAGAVSLLLFKICVQILVNRNVPFPRALEI